MRGGTITEELKTENESLRMRLEEAEATLDAIRNGEVDAVVVGGVGGRQVYTLESTEQFYRVLIEGMQQGAATLSAEGTILYCNRAFAAMLDIAQEKVAGTSFDRFVLPADLPAWQAALQRAQAAPSREEIRLGTGNRTPLSVQLALNSLPVRGAVALGLVVTDLTDQKRQEETDRLLLREETARMAAEEIAREAKRSENVLRESEERFRTLAVSTPMIVWTNLPDGRADYISQRWFDLTGQVYGSSTGWMKALHPEDLEHAEEIYTRSVRAGEAFEMEARFLRIADGYYRWHLIRAVPLRDADGVVVKFVGTCTDVDDLKQSQEQVQFQARLLDAVGQAAIATDPDGTIIYWNRFAESLYGWQREEALGRSIIELVVAPTGTTEASEVFELLKTGQSWTGEFLGRRRDGTTFPGFVSDTPIFDGQGQLKAVIGISADISERKRVEHSLRFLADASSILAAPVDGLSTLRKVASLAVPYFADWCVVDMAEADGSLRRLAIAHVDSAKVELAQELERRYPFDPDRPRVALRVLRSGKSELAEEIADAQLVEGARDQEHLRILRELGFKSYMCVPLKTRGKTLGTVSFVSAESGRRYTASDLDFAEELARRAAVALENSQLYADLRETDRLKDEFLAMLAHELRNPLGPIRNSLLIMKLPGTNDKMIQQVRDVAERQVQHMARLLDDLLDVSRISRGKIELRSELVDLKLLVSRTVEATRPFVEERRHQLTVSLPPDPLRVHGDPTRLEQVLTNLLNNSAKYTNPGGHISLAVGRQSGAAVLRVKDDGIGIGPHMLPKIFDLFVQADNRVDRTQGGVGIGLTLVRRLVELHGGTIEAHSPGLGLGSEFVVRLLATDELPAAERPTGSGIGAVAKRSPLRVLVVDDNQDAADSLAMLLELTGQEVRAAYNGPSALAQADDFRPSLILMDIGMPGMDGYEVARRMRLDSALKHVTLVALTGWGQDDDRRQSREAGFDHHLVKPVNPAELQEMMTKMTPAGQ